MKPKVSLVGYSRARLAVQTGSIAFLLLQSPAFSGNTWDGGGADNNWGSGANWSPDGSPAPGSGNDIFFAGSTRLSPFNNYTAFDDWRNITFNSGAGSFNLFGNAIDLFGKIENLSSNAQSVSLTSIALNSATANEFNPVNGNLTIFSTNIFTNGNQLKVFGNNGFTLSFSSGTNIQQAGSIAINQNSIVEFNSAHSYTGDTFINAGRLNFNSGASATSSIIRIGDTTGSANTALGLTANGGLTLSNTIVSRNGSSGTRTVQSTNTLSGGLFLDASLTVQQSGAGTLSLTGNSDVKQQAITFNTTGTTTVSGLLDSSFASGGTLVKSGSGTLTLSNSGNRYTGTNSASLNVAGTQIQAGTLAIGSDTALGLAPASAYNNIQFTGTGTLRANASIGLNANRNVSVASGQTATFDNNGNTFTINGVVGGTGGNVGSSGSGTTVFTGTNTYDGTTTISAGTLQIGNGGATGNLGSGAVTNNAALVFNRSGNFALTSAIGGTGTLAQSGSNIITISSANTYSGATTINSGVLRVTANDALGTGAAGTTVNSGGQLRLAGVAYSTAEALSINGTGSDGNGAIYSIGGTNSSYAGQITAASNSTIGSIGNTLTLTGGIVNNGNTLTFFGNGSGSVNVNTAGISGTGGSVVVNAATVQLNATNTYTGTTTVSNGVLAVNGSLANTTTTIGNGGTLRGSGSIAGSVTVQSGGTIAAGNSIESLATGALSLNSGSTFEYEIDNDAAASAAGDLTAVTGTLNIAGGAILTLSDLGSLGSWTVGEKLTLISYSGAWNNGLFTYLGNTLADDSTFNFSGAIWEFDYNDNSAGTNFTGDLTTSSFVTMTVIPEPSAALLGGLGLLALLRRRRA